MCAVVQKYLFILLILLCMEFMLIKNERIIKVTNMQCKAIDTKFCNITKCKMRAVERDVTEISMKCVLLQKPLTNVKVRGIFRKRGIETAKPLIDFEIDGCAFMRNNRRNVWAQLVYTQIGLANWSNINHTCPYDHDLSVEKFRFNGKEIIKYLPFGTGHYTLVTLWYSLNVLRSKYTFQLQIYEK